jgi:hypothetical protein
MKKLILLFITLFAIANILPAQTVYVTNTGKKYHVATCKYLSSSKIAIDLNIAIKKGYTPCKVCNPPTVSTSSPRVLDSKPILTPVKVTKSAATSGIRTGCICRDGTQSTATGRGACSHHGGVDHWLYK